MTQSTMQQSLGVTATMMVEQINRQGSGNIRVSVDRYAATASTDGNHICLPVVEDDKRFIALAYLGHEASHARVTDMKAFRAFAKQGPLHQGVLNIIEDIRIERSIVRVYPGLRNLLGQLVAHLVQEGTMGTTDGEKHPVVVFVNWLLHTRRAWVLRQSALDDIAKEDDALARSILGDDIMDRAEGILECLPTMGLDFKATAEAVAVAEQIIDLIREAEEQHNDQSQQEEQKGDSGDDQDQGESQGSGQGSQDEGSSGDAEGDSGSSSESDAGEGSDSGSDSGDSGSSEGSDSGKEDDLEQNGGKSSRKFKKIVQPWINTPVPDTDLGDVLQKHGHLDRSGSPDVELKDTFSFARFSHLPTYTGETRGVLAAEASALAGAVRRSLRALLEGQARNRRDPRRQGRLSSGSLPTVMTGNHRVFYREEFARAQSCAIHILLDVSGSMTAAESERGFSLMAESVIATHAMMEALEPLKGVRSALSVFPNGEEMEVWSPVPFSETFSGVKRKRAASLYPAAGGVCTPMLQSLRAVAGNLLAQPEQRKIAIVVTDGEPDRTGECPAEAVEEVRKMGVSVFGVGLGVDLSPIFGDQYVTVDKLEALSGELRKAARTVLR
ncbi:VWA domain-containing protein [Thioalkalivibrio sp. ALMg11]|uniref:VWA domain-containing protein n=1 Tax=Thioalkalivibrio sp. ALMg11 TaxID=1158165 RepID=UPI0003687DB1|nr:VWA domain-containing protein [Thioalkalivibrio sp. ALMg11]